MKTQLEAAKFDVIKYCIGITFFNFLLILFDISTEYVVIGVPSSVSTSKLEFLRSRSFMVLLALYVRTAEVDTYILCGTWITC